MTPTKQRKERKLNIPSKYIKERGHDAVGNWITIYESDVDELFDDIVKEVIKTTVKAIEDL